MKTEVKRELFHSAANLCTFVNEHQITKGNIQSIVEMKKQLTKAKEIIKKFLEFVNNEVEFDSEHPQEHTDLWIELCEKAEQFLRENE